MRTQIIDIRNKRDFFTTNPTELKMITIEIYE